MILIAIASPGESRWSIPVSYTLPFAFHSSPLLLMSQISVSYILFEPYGVKSLANMKIVSIVSGFAKFTCRLVGSYFVFELIYCLNEPLRKNKSGSGARSVSTLRSIPDTKISFETVASISTDSSSALTKRKF